MSEYSVYRSYMADCIHLHACRRIQQRYTNAGHQRVSRGCNKECLAYMRVEPIDVTGRTAALETAWDGAEMIRNGYDEFDVYVVSHFPRVEGACVLVPGPECTTDLEEWGI